MTNLKLLSGYFRVFELFGLQYFCFKALVENVQQKRSKLFYLIYFIFLLVSFSVSMTIYVAATGDDHIRFNIKTGFNYIIKVIIELGLIAIMIGGLIESYVKTSQLQEIVKKAKEISSFCKTEFNHLIDYENFNKTWHKKTYCLAILLFSAHGLMCLTFYVTTGIFLPLLIGFPPVIVLALIVFKFAFYVDLVNFQLENMHKVMLKSSCSKKTKQYHNCKILAFRRCYILIYDMAGNVNSGSSACLLMILTFFIVVIISAGYECLVIFIARFKMKVIIREFLLRIHQVLPITVEYFPGGCYSLIMSLVNLFGTIFFCQKTKNIVSYLY